MKTFQEFQEAVARGELIKFIQDAIADHRGSTEYKIAVDADEYDAQRNVTINFMVKTLHNICSRFDENSGRDSMGVWESDDTISSNHHIASNFFHRLNTERCTYSLGNGITFDDITGKADPSRNQENNAGPLVEAVREWAETYEPPTDAGIEKAGQDIKSKLGKKFDTDLYNLAYNALKHGVSFGFWNVDRLYVFPLTQFVPLWDESDGSLKAGIRFWSLDWSRKPVYAVLYEIDGFTKYRTREGFKGLIFSEIEPKRAYKQTVGHTKAGGDEIIGEGNYSALPIVPLYGNAFHQSTLVGMRAAIDAYDVIASGYCNDLSDAAEVYWQISNASGMSDDEVQHFLERMRIAHVAMVDSENSAVTPFTQEPPYNAREACLTTLAKNIYRDFGAFNPEDVAAGNITATQIRAAYQTQDEEADAFEYQIIECVQQILALKNLEGTPLFDRNRVANEQDEVNMVIAESEFLDDETVLDLFPNITTDMKAAILKRRAIQDTQRFRDDEELEDKIRSILAAMNQPQESQEPQEDDQMEE